MKYTFLTGLFAILLVVSCKPQKDTGIPSGIEEKRTLLAQKQTELGQLKAFIKELQDSIEAQAPSKKEGVLVTTLNLEKKDFKHFIEVQSNIEADDMVLASSEMGGRILNMPIKEGSYVSRGQLIATVDAEPIRKQIDQAQNSLNLAKDVFSRQSRLWKQKIGTEMQFLQAKNNVEQLEKTIELLNIQLKKANVYAPISGVVEKVILEAGELAGPGAPIVQILNPNKLKVVGQTPEIYIKNIRKGQRVKVVVPALDDMTFSAPVTLVGTSLNPANRTFKVEAATHSHKGQLKPNLLAKIVINDKTYPSVITIPADLIRHDVEENAYVMVLGQKDGQYFAKKVIVQTGDAYDGQIIITEGLKESDVLIEKGASGLVDGELVKVYK
ncbi:MAG TPA: efflux RND transporter periplasmic adaptor subunit [Saprospiraceae bacterium]|nr:efflux RND transporter periplasmic adaptor subunit [Saprospiraceae bacterium]